MQKGHTCFCASVAKCRTSCSFVCCPAYRLMAASKAKTTAFILSVVQTHPQANTLVEVLEPAVLPQGFLDLSAEKTDVLNCYFKESHSPPPSATSSSFLLSAVSFVNFKRLFCVLASSNPSTYFRHENREGRGRGREKRKQGATDLMTKDTRDGLTKQSVLIPMMCLPVRSQCSRTHTSRGHACPHPSAHTQTHMCKAPF